MGRKFQRIAIVSRGEPALRLIRAVRELRAEGSPALTTIALVTEPDRTALFARAADEVHDLGPAIARDAQGERRSAYLDYARLEAALTECGAEAVWPGWGFVAEHAAFADLCERLGLVFIGPSGDVMRRLGDKISSKRLAESAGVPVVPWSGGPIDAEDQARDQARRTGYPLMIKATAGGGGRGIRRVSGEADLLEAFRQARSEAGKAFGDPTVYFERLVEPARHVEVQVIADDAGTTWALGVRDCTVQRRNQKIIEEAPSPALDAEGEHALCEAAVRLCRSAGYRNAGTVEFLLEASRRAFWFMEVNARLQVEHPVTEVTTGVDIVKLQLHVAGGGLLPGDPPAAVGHAIEVRLNAEDPAAGFAPAPGRIERLSLPAGPGVRVDAGVSEGDTIPAEFDSMVAKVIAHGRDRKEALARLRRALGETTLLIRGGTSNKALLLDLIGRPEFESGEFDLAWLDRIMAREGRAPGPHAEVALLRAAIEAYEAEAQIERKRFYSAAARGRPEAGAGSGQRLELRQGRRAWPLEVHRLAPDRFRVSIEGQRIEVRIEPVEDAPLLERRARGSEWRLRCGDRSFRVLSVAEGLEHRVEVEGVPHRFSRDHQGAVVAPAPAIVVSVDVKEGDEVVAGDRLLLLEAMKMEMAVESAFPGRVREVLVLPNQQVGAGAPLLLVEPHQEADEAGPSTGQLDFAPLGATRQGRGDPASRWARLLAELRSLMLGYDASDADVEALVAECAALCRSQDLAVEAPVLEAIGGVLRIFVDLCSLFRRQPADDEGAELGRLSTEEHLFTYLRDPGSRGVSLPEPFVARLRAALAHYGVLALTPCPQLEESLYRIFKAHQREERHLALVLSLLERLLALGDALAPTPELRALLERLILEAKDRHPTAHDLARELRYRLFERPLLERARERVYDEARSHVEGLARDPSGAERPLRIAALVQCPQPLIGLLLGRFEAASPVLREALLEVITRRYYRIRDISDLRIETRDGCPIVSGSYSWEGRQVHVVTTCATSDRCAEALLAVRGLAGERPGADEVAVDLYVLRSGPLGEGDENEAAFRALVEAAGFPPPLPRVVVALADAGSEASGGMQHFTYRPDAGGRYVEDRFYRGAHPMMAKRLHMWRFANFELTRLPSPEDVYLLHGVARSNPRDERLFGMAEVRDLTPVRDEAGRVVLLPQLERMLMEVLGSIRRFQLQRPPEKRLHWNRVLLYIWPPFDLRPDEIHDVVHRLAPATDGLGVEMAVLRCRIPQADGTLEDTVVYVSNPAGKGIVVRFDRPTEAPIPPLTDYEQKVVRLRQRGLMYPYELIRMLTPAPEGTDSPFPPGDFVEHDLDGAGTLVPVERPYGANTANVVVGVIRSFTAKHPEGMSRVMLLGDPSRELGSLAEPECRRILRAFDLAERLRVPLEWLALSAGAKISMDSGTENMDWIAAVLRRIVDFTQAGGEVNVIVNGINVGAQPYWNAEATMLMHTRGILIMMPESAMVLTGKRALDYSGGVSAEDNQGIGGYERIMGPNGQAQYFARDILEACHLLLRHYEHAYVAPGEPTPRRAASADPPDRDVCLATYGNDGFDTVGDVFSPEKNPGRKKPFDMRRIMRAVSDQDLRPLERWDAWQDAETVVVMDAHLGGYPVCLLGIESRSLQRLGFVPADGPEQWSGGTLFPQSSRKMARAINAASGNRPVVVLANLTGFDGSPESLRRWQLEYGAEIGRAVVNFEGPLVFCVVSRYHGGAFVVFSRTLNEGLEVAALEGSYASVIGGTPAAAVVFTRDVERRVQDDPRMRALRDEIAEATPAEKLRLRGRLAELAELVQSEKLGEVAEEFDRVHSVHRALEVGSVHRIIAPSRLRPYLIDAVERGLRRPSGRARPRSEAVQGPVAAN